MLITGGSTFTNDISGYLLSLSISYCSEKVHIKDSPPPLWARGVWKPAMF